MARLNQQNVQVIREVVAEAVRSEIDSHISVEIETVAQIVAETYQVMMEQEAREVARAHGKMLETVAMIEEIASRGELDVSTLGEEAEKRAYALAVAMAERAVNYAENDLVCVKEQISIRQQQIAKDNMPNKNRTVLLDLLKQEESLTQRLKEEHRRLASLKLESRGLKLLTNNPTS